MAKSLVIKISWFSRKSTFYLRPIFGDFSTSVDFSDEVLEIFEDFEVFGDLEIRVTFGDEMCHTPLIGIL